MDIYFRFSTCSRWLFLEPHSCLSLSIFAGSFWYREITRRARRYRFYDFEFSDASQHSSVSIQVYLLLVYVDYSYKRAAKIRGLFWFLKQSTGLKYNSIFPSISSADSISDSPKSWCTYIHHRLSYGLLRSYRTLTTIQIRNTHKNPLQTKFLPIAS